MHPDDRNLRLTCCTALAGAALALAVLPGCTVTPVEVRAAVPALHGNVANGGVLYVPPKGVAAPAVVDQEFVDRYAEMAKKWGNQFSPPVHPGDGVQPAGRGTFTIDLEHLADAITMNIVDGRSKIKP